jgi:chromosome segregation ATPase
MQITLHRYQKSELEKAIVEMQKRGWVLVCGPELACEISPWVFGGQVKYGEDHQKWRAVMRKEVKAKHLEIARQQSELIDELLKKIDELERELKQAVIQITKHERYKTQYLKKIGKLTQENKQLEQRNKALETENRELNIKVKELAKKLSKAQKTPIERKGKVKYPAYVIVGQRKMKIGEFDTPEEARKAEERANLALS